MIAPSKTNKFRGVFVCVFLMNQMIFLSNTGGSQHAIKENTAIDSIPCLFWGLAGLLYLNIPRV